MLVSWRYRERDSFIQSFDPRAWLIFFMCFLVSVLFFWDIRPLAFFLVLTLFVLFTSKLKWHEIRRPFLFIGVFIIFYAVLTFLTGRGGSEHYTAEHYLAILKAHFSIFGWVPTLKISVERIMFALSQFVRVFSIAVMTIMIPYCMNPAYYGVTFHGLGMPDKFAYAMDLTMRFIPTFARDFQLTMDAQRARGYELEKIRGGLVQQVRKLAPLMVPVTIQAIISSEDIIDAMDLRCFGLQKRTWIQILDYATRDYVLIGAGILIVVISAIIRGGLGIGPLWVPAWMTAGLP
jgi:energy-coupling factor transport system permease protein